MPLRRLRISPPARAAARSNNLSTLPAHQLFDQISQQPPRTPPLALLLSRLLAGLPVSPIAFSAAVAASSSPLAALHALAVASGLDAFAPVSNALAARYAKSGAFPSAAKVFDAARARDVVSYNTLLSAFPDAAEGLAFAARMLRASAVRPDAVTFTVALSLAADQREAGFVRQLHALVSRTGFVADVFVGNALITGYSRRGFLDEAEKVFEEMPVRDLVSWNALICGLAQEGDCTSEVIWLFLEMVRDSGVRPDRISVGTVIPACADMGSVELGRQMHGFAVKLGAEGHVSVANVLVSMYYKCGALACACKAFEGMKARDVISWTAMMSMDTENAIPLFNAMRRDGVWPNNVTFLALLSAVPAGHPVREGRMLHALCFKTGISAEVIAANSLITMYAKLGRMDDARKVFDGMPDRELVTWNALVSGYAQNELCEDALQAFVPLIARLTPDEYTFASVLGAVTAVETVSLTYGQMCHCHTVKLGLSTSEHVSGALIDMYAKRGSKGEAQRAFDEAACRSIISWTAMISANAKHGDYSAVLSLFEDMSRSGTAPDRITFLSVLAACRYKGLPDTGRKVFDSMSKYRIEPWPEHFACLVDMLGRAGRLDEAEELMLQMPTGPNVSAMQSLLGACRIHGNSEVGERVAAMLTRAEPTESGAYVLLSNIYAEKEEWASVAKVRRQMRRMGVRKEVGYSWVDAGLEGALHMHRFSSDDTTHPLWEQIYAVAEELGLEMRFLKSSLGLEMESPV